MEKGIVVVGLASEWNKERQSESRPQTNKQERKGIITRTQAAGLTLFRWIPSTLCLVYKNPLCPKGDKRSEIHPIAFSWAKVSLEPIQHDNN